MAILAIFTGGLDKPQYETLRKEINWEGNQPKGAVFHAAGFDDSGRIRVADIWESPEAMNAFVESRLMPAFQKLGFTPPDVAVYPAHNINAYAVIEKYGI